MKKSILKLTLFLTVFLVGNSSFAQEGFIGEIRMFAGNFAPKGWAICDGRTLQISENSALFSILGTVYGGDGRQTFNLPDLRGRVAVGAEKSTDAKDVTLGETGGSENVDASGFTGSIDGEAVPLASGQAVTGKDGTNMQPYLGINYIICVQGTYPSRN